MIIRDVKREDQYPDGPDSGKGISAWFRVELLGTYHRGVKVGLRLDGLVFDEQGNCWRRYKYGEEEPTLNACLVGHLPFEDIVEIDWEGDEYYMEAHLYCYFRHNGEPYEELNYQEFRSFDDRFYYREIAKLEEVENCPKAKRRL